MNDVLLANRPDHLCLRDVIDRLQREDPSRPVAVGFGQPHSYRGYYHDLAFELVRDTTVGAMLAAAESALGATYQGWKGGDYEMSEWSVCWLVAERGACGESIGAVLLDLLLAGDSGEQRQDHRAAPEPRPVPPADDTTDLPDAEQTGNGGAKVLKVTWHPEAIRTAIDRALAVLKGDGNAAPDVYRFPGGFLTLMDLACLIDAGRAFLPPESVQDGEPR